MTELLPDGSDWSRPECRLLAIDVPMATPEIGSVPAPIPGVALQTAVTRAERTRVTSDSGDGSLQQTLYEANLTPIAILQ